MSKADANRPIDVAMIAPRDDKDIIRALWVEDVKNENKTYTNQSTAPLYLTLCGANGIDILLLEKEDIISFEQNGALSAQHTKKVVAIEGSKQATLRLQEVIKGLKILEKDVNSLMRGDNLTKYPDRNEAEFLSARVINLDFNAPLLTEFANGLIAYPQITWIQKIATIQRQARNEYWKLYMTLNSSINCSDVVLNDILDFLKQNMDSSIEFSMLLNEKSPRLCSYIEDRPGIENLRSDTELCQHLLMVFVPKKIASVLSGLGYVVDTEYNICYGGQGKTAPMVTWIIKCKTDPKARIPSLAYTSSLPLIFRDFGDISQKRAQ